MEAEIVFYLENLPTPLWVLVLLAIAGIIVQYVINLGKIREGALSESREVPEWLKRAREELDDEAGKFLASVRGKPTNQWDLGDHAWYLSIRRREELLDCQ